MWRALVDWVVRSFVEHERGSVGAGAGIVHCRHRSNDEQPASVEATTMDKGHECNSSGGADMMSTGVADLCGGRGTARGRGIQRGGSTSD